MSKNIHKLKINPTPLLMCGLVMAMTIPLNLNLSANGKTISLDVSQNQESREEQDIIYVNPRSGDDSQGKGTQRAPLKTITQALNIAQPKTLIMLAPGTYSRETGEQFPLQVNLDVKIQGSPVSKGHNTIISGGGLFVYGTRLRKNVTIAAIEQAGEVSGVTVINPDPRGAGLLIASANPKITHNTFTRTGSTGVVVDGKSAAVIAKNYFYNNGGNGLLVLGDSQAEVTDNEFEKTGYGVSLMENATAVLSGNKLKGNKIGVILEGDSEAVLRHNLIANSTEQGLVAIAQSWADLGSPGNPGGNSFYRTRGFDLNNTSENPIIAFGNELTGKIQGNVDLTGNLTGNSVVTSEQPLLPVSSNRITSNTPLPPPPNTPETTPETREIQVISAASQNNSNNSQVLPAPRETVGDPDLIVNEIGAIEIPVPPPETNIITKYRVLVATSNTQDNELVRVLFPDAFSTVYNGQSMLQVGLFNSQDKAVEALEALKLNGFRGVIVNEVIN